MRKIYILIFMHIVSVISAQGGNITVMDATIDDSRYYMASTMKEMISAEYTGEIRYDGSNHRLVFYRRESRHYHFELSRASSELVWLFSRKTEKFNDSHL